MANPFTPAPNYSDFSGVDGTNKDKIVQVGALQVGDDFVFHPDNMGSDIFTLDTDIPTDTDSYSFEIKRVGPYFYIFIEFAELVMEVTDAGASGSFGNVRLGFFTGDDFMIQTARLFIEGIGENGLAAFTGDTTDTLTTITNVSSTAGLQVGATVTGVGIGAGARIESIDSLTQITLTVASTATGAGIALTQPAISGDDTAFELSLATDSIGAAADGDVGAFGDDNADLALIAVADVGAFTEDSNGNPVARLVADQDVFINWSGSAATVDASGSLSLTGNVRLIGVLLALD
jgi:hypothetical protein